MSTGATTLGNTCWSTTRLSRAPQRLGGVHEFELTHHQHLPSDQPRHAGPTDDADRQEHDAETGLKGGGHRYEQEERRKGERHVREAHHDLVDPSAVVAGNEAHREADEERDRLRYNACRERHAGTVDETGPDIAPLDVGAEPV